jgi:aryl-alcohol dehydrogenase-like predicted oxidoreductase
MLKADHPSAQALARIAEKHGASAAQLSLAWLLKKSPVMLPIPGTSKVEHLEQNVSAAAIRLSAEDCVDLDGMFRS